MTEKIKVLYLCDFDLSKGTGKDRATAQKLRALKDKVSSLRVVSNRCKIPFLRLFAILSIDIFASIIIILKRPDWFISRGYSGSLALFTARILGVLSVREVHAFALQEYSLLPYSGAKLGLIRVLAHIAHRNDLVADVRIFNHPDLLNWYRKKGLSGPDDFYVYNGCDPLSKCELSKAEARDFFGFGKDDRLVVFVGAATKWHGVDYLVDLQAEFIEKGDNIKIVFGGGDISEFDSSGICSNFSPLDNEGCAKLIRAADFCALPVKPNRVSPGSPLKLYDYIVNERFVLAQSDTNGYSDEVERFSVGIAVDFKDVSSARKKVLDAFDLQWPEEFPSCAVSWSDRMSQWINGIRKSKKA